MMDNGTPRPTTYRDWKLLWHSAMKAVGCMVLNRFDGRSIKIDRHLWYHLRRLQRIDARMQVERQVKDRTWAEEMIRALMTHL